MQSVENSGWNLAKAQEVMAVLWGATERGVASFAPGPEAPFILEDNSHDLIEVARLLTGLSFEVQRTVKKHFHFVVY